MSVTVPPTGRGSPFPDRGCFGRFAGVTRPWAINSSSLVRASPG
jgi:hypothetical protein